MSTVHILLQGKGGVGKSLVATLLLQYTIANGRSCVGIDTDPVNASFSQFASLPIQRIQLLNDGEIDSSEFDRLMERFLSQDDDIEFVVDNGAASFIPLCSYLLKNQAVEFLEAEGHRVFVHTVITGGPALRDTLSGLDSIVSQFPTGMKIVVWANPFFGAIDYDGKPFEELRVIQKHMGSLSGIVHIPKQNGLFAEDMRTLLERHLTFEDAAADKSLGLMNRRRLSIIRDNLFGELDESLRELSRAG